MSDRRRLIRQEVDVLTSLVKQGASVLPSALRSDQRAFVVPLWRWQLVELWFRRPPAELGAMQGPYYRLTDAGIALAHAILEKRSSIPAPRGFSGAEQSI